MELHPCDLERRGRTPDGTKRTTIANQEAYDAGQFNGRGGTVNLHGGDPAERTSLTERGMAYREEPSFQDRMRDAKAKAMDSGDYSEVDKLTGQQGRAPVTV